MYFEDVKLTETEKITLLLRGLYERNGFKKFNMARFEEYGFYAANRDFITGKNVLTFTDLDGRLMALKPDVTLSIIKNTRGNDAQKKLYYVENVYRENKGSNNFKEVSQIGVEYIGNVNENCVSRLLDLALESLSLVDAGYILEVSNMDFANSIINSMDLNYENYVSLLKLIRQKNIDGIKAFGKENNLSEGDIAILAEIPKLHGSPNSVIERAKEISGNSEQEDCLEFLRKVLDSLNSENYSGLSVDLSIINDIGYYNGIIFNGYVPGIADAVLSGGQYDKAMKKFGRKEGGLGFAIYLDELSRKTAARNPAKKNDDEIITIALPKGRLADEVHNMLEQAGYSCPEYSDKDRRLVLENPDAKVRYLLVKPADVSVYVEHNVADIGIVGKDILMENSPNVYELLDLNIGKCKMCVAAPKGFEDNLNTTLQVATKYVNVAKKYYGKQNRDIEIIKLNGSIELGPILELTDVIVDIVETGTTLKENNLEIVEAFEDISARVIAGKHAFNFKNARIKELVNGLSAVRENPLKNKL